MNNEDTINKLKEILKNMNSSETPLDSFYEMMEKETGGKLTFSNFRIYLDKFYSNVNKLDRIFFLKQLSIESDGRINLTDLFNYFSKILNQTIASPILAFYNIASIIEKKLKISTLEFIYKNGLSLEDEININDFYIKIADSLKIDDISTIIVFKGLDRDKKGKIRIEDFVIVIDSYREDSNLNTIESNSKQKENEIVKLINDIKYIKSHLDEEDITVEDIYTKTDLGPLAKFYEIYNNIKLMIKDINTDILENVLNFLKKEDTKIYKKDFENLIIQENIDQNFIVNYIKSKNKVLNYNKFTLNDMQTFWINKLCALLDLISITPMMAFQTAAIDKLAKEMNLDNFKRKLQKMIPPSRVSALELNNIADSLDINKNKMISFEDFNEVIECGKNDPKFSVMMKSSDNLLGGTNTLINSFVKSKRNNNDLPMKGNTKALSVLKTDLSKTHSLTPSIKKDPILKIDNNFLKESKSNNKNEKENLIIINSIQTDPIQEFIKELSVFENGEWSLIEILEDLYFNQIGVITTFDLNNIFHKKFYPTISKTKLFLVIKNIDSNQDGFISIIDLINFLLNNFKHRSTKLALKEIARKIEYEEKLSTEDFFSRKSLQPTNEINFVNFIQFFIKNFEIDPPVIKKIYDELRKILTNKPSIFVSDVIDLINEYRMDNIRNKDKIMNKNYNSISLLDKKYYEEEMRKFVRFLQKGFGNNSNLFRENLDHFLNLPNFMSLSQFREMFIKPLMIDYSLGIATFQLLRSFSNKENFIPKEDLYNLIDSYVDSNEIVLDSEVMVNLIENKYTPIKYCFESIPFNYKGITVMEILKSLEVFYPQMNKKILLNLSRGIDKNQIGIVTFFQISIFLYKNSKKDPFSNELIIKYLASLIDYKNVETKEFIMIEIKLKKSDKIVNFTEHNEFFNTKLKFEYEQSENLFLYLANNCPYSNGYILDRLIRLVNLHRLNKSELKKTQVYDNTSQVMAIKAQSVEFTELLRILNENVNLSDPFSKLSVSMELRIAVYDIFLIICQTYENLLDLDKKLLIRLLKSIDNEKKGSLLYENLIKHFKNYLDEFEINILLHCKFLSCKLYKEYEGKWKDYLNYKGVNGNKFITREQFENIFKEECFYDESISHNLFEFMKEKKGANSNLLFVQNFVDYLNSLTNVSTNNKIDKKLTKEEIEDHIKSSIYRVEKDQIFNLVFDNINMRQVNQFGKINSENMRMILKETFSFDDFTIEVFIDYFCKLLTLFDLFKFVEFIQIHSEKSAISIEDIILKIKLKISRDTTLTEFVRKFNLNLYKPLTLSESCLILNPIFGLTNYECFFLFKEIVSNESNSLQDTYKINFDFIIQLFSLYKMFKNENEKKEIKLKPNLLNASKKLIIYLDSLTNKMQFFKKFDKDLNGCLERKEFLNLLNSCEGVKLNDSEKINLLNFADKNNDDNINYIEFVDFLNNIRSELGELEVLEKKEENKTIEEIKQKQNEENLAKRTKYHSILKQTKASIVEMPVEQKVSYLDNEKLKINYEYNLKNIDTNNETPFNIVLFYIQEELFNKINNSESFEFILMNLDKDNTGTLPKEEFFFNLNKIDSLNDKIDEENEEKLWNYSMEGYVKKVKNKLILENIVNYRNFLENIVNFKVRAKIQKMMRRVSVMKNLVKSDLKLNIFNKNSNILRSLKENNTEKVITNNEMNLNLEKYEEIEKIQNSLKQTFTFGNDSNVKKEIDKNFDDKFKSFMEKVTNLPDVGYEYSIKPNIDYFKRPDGKIIETILNNEDAAIKKCEEIYSSIKEGESYLDKEFGSAGNDRGNTNRMSLYSNGKPPKGYLDPQLIEWYRMTEICPDEEPLFIDGGLDANDVCQGAIGNCWFISALSVLATKDHLLRGELNSNIFEDGDIDEEECVQLSTGVYPPIFHCFRLKGIYCFRFFKNFEWKYVIIDDRLPCRKVFSPDQPKKLIFGKCKNEREFWVPLIEKAYAKLHGSYEALISGFIDDGLVDLTGLVARKIMIDSQQLANSEMTNQFWEMIKIYSQKSYGQVEERRLKSLILTSNNTMMGCSIDAKVVESEVVFDGKKCGILAGHAYAILDAFEIPKPTSIKQRKTSRLVRIRNPWGYKEWIGKWSDESPELQNNRQIVQETLNKLYQGLDEKIDLDAEDGSFLMCYSDFRRLYNKIFVCIDFPNSYVGINFFDSWTKEESGGIPINNRVDEMKNWARNPQYYLNIKKTTTVMISLLQPDGRLTNSKFPYADTTKKTCLVISKTLGKERLTQFDNNKIVLISSVRQHRENTIYQILEQGEYIISACTFRPNETGQFCLEIHFEDSFIDSNYNETNFHQKLKNTVIERLGDTQNKVKINLKKETNIQELKEVNDKKKTFIYRQFKNMLMSLSQNSQKLNPKSKENKKKNIIKEAEEDFDEF